MLFLSRGKEGWQYVVLVITDIIQNQEVLQQSMLQVMTDLNKIKAALLKSNMQECDAMYEAKRHTTEEGFLGFCEGINEDSSKRDLFVGFICYGYYGYDSCFNV